MGLPNAPRGGGGRRAYVHVPYVSTRAGQTWCAYVAGPCQWFSCHTSSRTKPCLHEMTGGMLACARNHDIDAPQVIGYQPLRRQLDGRPVMVIVYELQREHVDKLPLHSLVVVGRGTEPTDTVYVRSQAGRVNWYTSTIAANMQPIDVTETLLKIWAMPELTEWYRHSHGLPPTQDTERAARIRAGADAILDGKRRTIADTVHLALGDPPQDGPLAAEYQALIDRAKRNGKHKPDE
jgi:hypothetical protein